MLGGGAAVSESAPASEVLQSPAKGKTKEDAALELPLDEQF